jgi:hypothetical protein
MFVAIQSFINDVKSKNNLHLLQPPNAIPLCSRDNKKHILLCQDALGLVIGQRLLMLGNLFYESRWS